MSELVSRHRGGKQEIRFVAPLRDPPDCGCKLVSTLLCILDTAWHFLISIFPHLIRGSRDFKGHPISLENQRRAQPLMDPNRRPLSFGDIYNTQQYGLSLFNVRFSHKVSAMGTKKCHNCHWRSNPTCAYRHIYQYSAHEKGLNVISVAAQQLSWQSQQTSQLVPMCRGLVFPAAAQGSSPDLWPLTVWHPPSLSSHFLSIFSCPVNEAVKDKEMLCHIMIFREAFSFTTFQVV